MADEVKPSPSEWATNTNHDEFADLNGRLYNWKFSSALAEAERVKDKISTDEYELIKALAAMFGNCGWIDGDIETIIGAALDTLPQPT